MEGTWLRWAWIWPGDRGRSSLAVRLVETARGISDGAGVEKVAASVGRCVFAGAFELCGDLLHALVRSRCRHAGPAAMGSAVGFIAVDAVVILGDFTVG